MYTHKDIKGLNIEIGRFKVTEIATGHRREVDWAGVEGKCRTCGCPLFTPSAGEHRLDRDAPLTCAQALRLVDSWNELAEGRARPNTLNAGAYFYALLFRGIFLPGTTALWRSWALTTLAPGRPNRGALVDAFDVRAVEFNLPVRSAKHDEITRMGILFDLSAYRDVCESLAANSWKSWAEDSGWQYE